MITALGLGIGLGLVGGTGTARAELKVGDQAPPFTLKGSDGKTYSLDQFKGKSAVVIAWFPKAFTGGCTKECKSLRANSKALHDLKVAYFTASVDTPELNKKFAESLDLDYPILSDPDKSVAKAYGVLKPQARRGQSLDVLHRQGRDDQGDRQEGQAPTAPAPTSPPRSRSWGSPPSRAVRTLPADARRISRAVLGTQLGPVPRLQLGPALLQLAEDRPEEPAVHPAGNAPAAAGTERLRLGVLEVVCDLVEERVEQLVQRPPAFLAVVRVDPHQAPGLVVAAQHARGRPGVDVDGKGDPAGVDPLAAGVRNSGPRAEIGGSKRPRAAELGRVAGGRSVAIQVAGSGSARGRRRERLAGGPSAVLGVPIRRSVRR